MSYKNPIITAIENPVGVEIPIQSIKTDLTAISWLQYSFGRAWEFAEKHNESNRVIKVPKVYDGSGEYMNVLPNDMWNAYSFIMCEGEEKWNDDIDIKGINRSKNRKLNIIFWFNFKEIVAGDMGVTGREAIEGDYIATERLKQEVENILRMNYYVSSIDGFIDEKAEDVFKGYVGRDNEDSEYLMHPYSGFRFTVTVNYSDNNC